MAKKKKKKKEKKELEQISSSKILIRVYKDFGSKARHLKAEYLAQEKRDLYNNLVSINENYMHNEDTDFAIDEVYSKMNSTLELKDYTNAEKIEIIDKNIEKQAYILECLEKYPTLNCMYNFLDESLKKEDLLLLKEYIQHHDENGSFFTIEKGMRVYSFESKEGFLVPIWHGLSKHTQYPDHTRKKKISIQEDIIMKQELALYNKDKLAGNILKWGMAFNIILFAILVFGIIKVWDMHNNLETDAHAGALSCVEYTSRINKELVIAMENNLFNPVAKEQQKPIEGTVKALKPPNIIR